ncbi:DUF397 domain-containing protein [Streptomyces sp. NPDC101133]|uniref:DUF397 domain-containing protein n=1 Tax=Streptomyces sp. NPDC101133 TaxID=3366111 RepID=UPI00382BEE52
MALSRHKSSYSSGSQGDCVKVASCPGTVHVRDSKVPHGNRLAPQDQVREHSTRR